MFMPKDFFESVILVETNKAIQGPPITFGEFLQFIGIWLYMAITAGFNRAKWFSRENIDHWDGAPCRFNNIMSGRRFEAIIAALRFTATPVPPFQDKFHEVRDLISAWNDNMTETFSPSWVSCLDESMSKWKSHWTCPGFMFVPQKPWPMGNEYHSVCCALSGIMYSIELVEGKDRP
jgi:Transposase IS4